MNSGRITLTEANRTDHPHTRAPIASESTSDREAALHISSIENQYRRVTLDGELAVLRATNDLRFHGHIIIQSRKDAIRTANTMSNSVPLGILQQFVLFVDASINEKAKQKAPESTNAAGAAVVYQTPGGKWEEKTFCLANGLRSEQAEISAIAIAVWDILRKRRNAAKVVIFTDYQAAMFQIHRFRNTSSSEEQLRCHPILRSLVENSQYLYSHGVDVEIRWVPGHSGVEGNMRAHTAARTAARQAPDLPAPRVPPRLIGCRSGIAESVIRMKACGQLVCGYLTSNASCTEKASGHRF